MQSKVYVAVLVQYSPEGELRPLSVQWEDGRNFSIDRILDVRRAASLKAGGAGIRYTVCIGRYETYLFFEAGRWFVQRR